MLALSLLLLAASGDACRVVVPAPKVEPKPEYFEDLNDARIAKSPSACGIADANIGSAMRAILNCRTT